MCRFSKLLLFSFFFCKDGSDRLMKRASCSCCNFLCVVLAAAYLKYRRCHLSCLPFFWHFFFHCDTHTHTHTQYAHTCACAHKQALHYLWQNQSTATTLRFCQTTNLHTWLIFVNFVNGIKLWKLAFTEDFFIRVLLDGRPQFTKLGFTKQEISLFTKISCTQKFVVLQLAEPKFWLSTAYVLYANQTATCQKVERKFFSSICSHL